MTHFLWFYILWFLISGLAKIMRATLRGKKNRMQKYDEIGLPDVHFLHYFLPNYFEFVLGPVSQLAIMWQ